MMKFRWKIPIKSGNFHVSCWWSHQQTELLRWIWCFFFLISITFSSISSTYFSYCWIIPSMWPLAQRWPNFACSGGDLRHVFGHRDGAPSAVPGWIPQPRFTVTNIWPICNDDARMMIIFEFSGYISGLYDTCMILAWYLYDCIRKACHVSRWRLWTRS